MEGWMGFATLAPLIIILIVWSLFWKGLGLWHAAKRGEGWWFLAILLLNTAGILEIVYLFIVSGLRQEEVFSAFRKKQ